MIGLGLISVIAGAALTAVESDAETITQPMISHAEIVAVYPHDDKAFTQGLFFSEGHLYESTGQVGASTIRQVNIKTGVPTKVRDLPATVFGEGSTAVGDKIITLTWRAGKGYVHDLETLAPESEFEIEGEGWGLTYNDEYLIMSDGTPTLRFLDSETYEEIGKIDVMLQGKPVRYINELEWVEGDILANVWQSDWIIRIDPETGNVTELIDVSALHPAAKRRDANDEVPNGIAYEPQSKRLFVTGKNWPSLFEINLSEGRK